MVPPSFLPTHLPSPPAQIKEVLNRQDDGEDAEDAGPLAEVQFWSSRTIDLSGIDSQLKRPEVALIVQVLETAKSSYLPPFLTLSDRIQKGTSEAVDNLHFLENLNEPCSTLANATPQEIPAILPPTIGVIRLIWRYSKFYNTPTRLIALIREIGSAEHPRGQDAPGSTAGTAWASRSRTLVFVDNH